MNSTEPTQTRLVQRLFKRFQARYGRKALTMYGGIPEADIWEEWGEQLGKFTPDDIRAALDASITTHLEFPPTLPQFVDLCKSAQQRRATTSAPPPPPHSEMPEAIKQQLREFVDKVRGKEYAR